MHVETRYFFIFQKNNPWLPFFKLYHRLLLINKKSGTWQSLFQLELIKNLIFS